MSDHIRKEQQRLRDNIQKSISDPHVATSFDPNIAAKQLNANFEKGLVEKALYEKAFDQLDRLAAEVNAQRVGYQGSYEYLDLDKDEIQKGKRAKPGEIREWKGGKFQKLQSGKWVPVGDGKSKKDKQSPEKEESGSKSKKSEDYRQGGKEALAKMLERVASEEEGTEAKYMKESADDIRNAKTFEEAFEVLDRFEGFEEEFDMPIREYAEKQGFDLEHLTDDRWDEFFDKVESGEIKPEKKDSESKKLSPEHQKLKDYADDLYISFASVKEEWEASKENYDSVDDYIAELDEDEDATREFHAVEEE